MPCVRFPGVAVLPGVSVCEDYDSVIVLVPTVASVHKLVLPHPNKLGRRREGVPQGCLVSVLSGVSAATATANCHW